MKTYHLAGKWNNIPTRNCRTYRSIIICLLIVAVTACIDKKSKVKSETTNYSTTKESDYLDFLQDYQSVPLSNDTILYGFRIGMTTAQLQNHLKDLITQGRIINQNHKLYGLLPTNEYCRHDKDSVHQFITELFFHVDKQNQTLTSIYASLYAPRFYITPLSQRKSEEELMKNPAYRIYREINGDSATAVNDRDVKKPETYARIIEKLLYPPLLDNYQMKYGHEIKELNDTKGTNHIWIDNGRLIRLNLSNDVMSIANKFLYRKSVASKEEFSDLIPIGELEYSSVGEAIKFETELNEAASLFQRQMDSFQKKQQEKEVEETKERVRKSGI